MTNRHTRKVLNRLADHIEEVSEWLVSWLRVKAQRELRVKPLAFETDGQLMLRLLDKVRGLAPSFPLGEKIIVRFPDSEWLRADLKAYRYDD